MFFNILVIGPCDSGKTTFIESISKKLDIRFKIYFPNLSSYSPINTNSENNLNNEENLISDNNRIQRRRSFRRTSIGEYFY